MRTKIKTKLIFALVFLFVVIICFGILGVFYINRLSNDAGMILQDNHISVEYCNRMMKALDKLPDDTAQFSQFEKTLRLQEKNISEPGEFEATLEVRSLFETFKKSPGDFSQFKTLRTAIFKVEDLNQEAIIHKNLVASKTAEQANFWFIGVVTGLTLIAFTFVLNFPSIISKPIMVLTDGIQEIARKNYSKRIHLNQKDEFGVLADTFNTMAEKLDEYEHSNLAQIKLEKTRIETIINKMNDGIIGLNEKNKVLFFNSEAENLFGLKEKEVIGKPVAELAIHNDLLRTVLQNDTKKQLKIFNNKKESYFDQESIAIENGIGGQVILLRNVTPFKELDVAKTNFIATISHELKTPLFAIKMSTQLLEDERVGGLNKDQREILESLKGNSERLLKITGELLNMSQVEAGHIQLRKETTKPDVIVLRALQAVQQHALNTNIQIKESIEKNLPSIVVDEEKTTWVLINLLTNAIKYSNENGIVEIKVIQNKNDLVFSVTDNGKGIEEQYVSHVFDKYFKVPGTIERSGTGLGLSISKQFIEAQAGTIWVKSEYGTGSTFGFDIKITT